MKIKLNDTEHEILSTGTSLLQLLQDQSLYQEHGIAVAINDEIVPRPEWSGHPIKENDHILIITATQGG